MKKLLKPKLFILISCLCFTLTIFFAGCKKNEQKPETKNQSAESDKESEKAPEELESIESSIEKIIADLGGPASSKKESTTTQKEKTGTEQKQSNTQEKKTETENKSSGTGDKKENQNKEGSDNQQQGDSSSKESTKQQGDSSNKETTKQQGTENQSNAQSGQKDPWQQILPIINKLHYDWSSYTPKAAKMGANSTLLDNFGKALNDLTNSTTEKNKENTLLTANHLYGYIPDFYSLYREKTSPEIKRVRYYIRNSTLNSTAGNWEKCDSDINSLKSSWSLYKNTLEKETQELSSKLDFSIYELEKVIRERSQQLIDIKARVALSNIDALEEAVKKGSEQSKSREGK